jgi:hypothetical protein
MKIKITIEGADVKLALTPDSELEKLVIQELGDDVSISRSHQSLVLRRRANQVRTITDDIFAAESEITEPDVEQTTEQSSLRTGNGRL